MKIVRFDYGDRALFEQVERIRTEVFVIEQNCPLEEEFDGFDEQSTHYLIYCDEMPVATGRWREIGDWIKLERFCVVEGFRGKGLGRELVDAMLKETKGKGKKIYLNSQVQVIGLYEKHGFKVVGDSFDEVGIVHYKMVYND